jgi:antitoxin component YwqK of YwqJK toxin-antitoxin module
MMVTVLIIVIVSYISIIYIPAGTNKWSYIIKAYMLNNGNEGIIKPPKQFSGIWNQWYSNGVLRSRGHILNGIEHGEYINWSKEGKILSKSTWRHGALNGSLIKWDYDRNIMTIYQFEHSEMVKKIFENTIDQVEQPSSPDATRH